MRMQLDFNPLTARFEVEGVAKDKLESINGVLRSIGPERYEFQAKFSQGYMLAKLVPEECRTASAKMTIEMLKQTRDDAIRAYEAPVAHHEEGFFDYQVQTGRLLSHLGAGFVHDRTGLGKTRSVLAALMMSMGPHLIVCPKIAMGVWESECRVIDPDFKVIRVEGSMGERRELIEQANMADFVIINYEVIHKHSAYYSHGKEPGDMTTRELNLPMWGSVVFDEAHRIKNPGAVRSRTAWMLGQNAERRYAVTATPITQNPGDIWSQLRAVFPGEFDRWGKFRDRFLDWMPNMHGGVDIFGWRPHGKAEFDEIMGWRTSCRQWDDEDVVEQLPATPDELPPKVYSVPLSKAERDRYNTMVDSWFADVDGGLTIAGSPLEAMIRCRQMANGELVIHDDKVVGVCGPSAKFRALADLVADADGPVLVYADLATVLVGAKDYLESKDIGCRIITGEIGQSARELWIREFQAGTVDVLLCTVGAASEAVSLTNASLLVFLQESWSLLHMTQARGRVTRIGSTKPVPVVILQAEDTIEQSVNSSLADKADFLDEFIGKPDLIKNLLRGIYEEEKHSKGPAEGEQVSYAEGQLSL